MTGEGSFEDGYRDGWMGVAGDALMPPNPTRPPAGERADYRAGFEYGRSDALERFTPGVSPRRSG